eukprot:GHRR01012465.1.p1 GENE.GHRR01012465.1~~GHRR01012465.1.p1  ORF type:complete len:205 (+),score=56.37 GHRR01012465.1:532-1146(+)
MTAHQSHKSVISYAKVTLCAHAGDAIAQNVIASPLFQQAHSVGLYIASERLREVDTVAVLKAAMQQGKQCFVPLVEDQQSNMLLVHIEDLDDLHPVPPFGILEPKKHYADGRTRQHALQVSYGLDLLLMPGLGFNMHGARLGRGGGYYDKLVSQLQSRAREHGWQQPHLVALAFREQLVEQIPMGPQDRRVDILATADGMISCS